MNNALKPAFAKSITIQLIVSKETLFINVQDDGVDLKHLRDKREVESLMFIRVSLT